MILKRRADIDRFLKAPDGAVRAALIHGRDLGVVRERAQVLAAATTQHPEDPFDVALLTEEEVKADEGRLHEELMAVSMMGGRRLVRLRLGGDRTAADRASFERVAQEALEKHLLGQFNPDAFFLIESWDLDGKSALGKAAVKASNCVVIRCYADEPGDLSRLTREILAKDRLGLASDAVELFVARLPEDRGVAKQEIERLALFLGPGSGRIGTAAELEDFLGVEPEASLSDAASDAFGGRLAAAYAGLRRAAREGEAGPAAVRAMGQHLGKLRRTAVLHDGGASLPEAAKASGVFWKIEREFLRQARTWRLPQLDRLQPDVLAADLACKQTGAPDTLIAERLALTIAGQARRLGL